MEVQSIKIGDRIVGKRTGTLTPATVVGFLPARYSSNFASTSKWDNLYPDWRDKYVVYAQYDEPTKPCSIHEYEEQIKDDLLVSDSPFLIAIVNDKSLYSKFIKHQYNLQVPDTMMICFPVDDVDLLQ